MVKIILPSFLLLNIISKLVTGSYDFLACNQPLDIGNCSDPIQSKYFYNSKTEECESADFSVCPGNNNFFDLKNECKNRCEKEFKFNCTLPKDEGKSFKAVTESYNRWFYNITNDACETFKFSGVGGNLNNFLTKMECDRFCRDPKVNGYRCDGPKIQGNCSEIQPKWYFHHMYGCMRFNYSGCDGSSNRFDDSNSCLKACKYKIEIMDNLPAICKMLLKSENQSGDPKPQKIYYFDMENLECKEINSTRRKRSFHENSFQTMEHCTQYCSTDITQLQKKNFQTKAPSDPDNGATLNYTKNYALFMCILFILYTFIF